MYHQLSNNILNNIFKYCPDLRCSICYKNLTPSNIHRFFNYPPNLSNKCYCSWICFNYT